MGIVASRSRLRLYTLMISFGHSDFEYLFIDSFSIISNNFLLSIAVIFLKSKIKNFHCYRYFCDDFNDRY